MSESAGSRLKKLRLEKGLSLEEAHKKTKIHLDILKAIEEDSLVNLNPIYIKGFLKIYCKFLGVNPEDYISGYRISQPAASADKEDNASIIKKPEPKFTPVKLDYLNSADLKKLLGFIVVILISLLFLLGLFQLGKLVSARKRRPVTNKPKVIANEPLKTAGRVEPARSPRNAQLATVRLGISAKEDCWIQLKVDGRVVFRRVLKRGKFESWEARERIDFSLSNAGGVVLDVNGQVIPPLGRRGQTVKNIVITREGLSIPR